MTLEQPARSRRADALEVLGNPKIIDDHTLAHFYLREGSTGDDTRLETESAVRAGLQVEKELHARSICRCCPRTSRREPNAIVDWAPSLAGHRRRDAAQNGRITAG